MSQISIAQRYRPYTHQPGSPVILPGSGYVVRAYPVRLELLSLEGELLAEREWDLKGPVGPFTVQLDLEKGRIAIWGEAANGYYRYFLRATENGVRLEADKGPMQSETLLGQSGVTFAPPPLERIAFGDHHKQEWEQVKRRNNLAEILPYWFLLAQQTPTEEGRVEISSLSDLFQSHFSGLLVPRRRDTDHQGLPPLSIDGSPLLLLTEGARLVRSLILTEEREGMSWLPALPKELVSGRAIGLQTAWGELSLEWRSRKLRRAFLLVKKSGSLRLHLPKGTKRVRFNGARVAADSLFEVEEGTRVEWDRFER